MSEPNEAAAAVVEKKRWTAGRTADLIVTLVLLIANPIAIGMVGLFAALLLIGGADSQNDTSSGQQLTTIAFLGCIVVAIGGTVVSIVLLVRRHLAWWVALITFALVCVGGFLALGYWNSLIG